DRGGNVRAVIGMPAIGMKSKVTGPRASTNLRRRRIIGLQRSSSGVVLVDHDFVQAQVGDDGKSVGGVQVDGMGMRSFLSLLVDAGAVMLDEGRGRAKPAVRFNRKDAHASSRVIGGQHMLACLVYDQMARSRSTRRSLIQQHQIPSSWVDGKCADRSAAFALKAFQFTNGEEKALIRMNGKKRR